MKEPRSTDATEQVEAFMGSLPDFPEQPTRAIFDAVDKLEVDRSTLGRPLVGEVSLDPDYREFIPVFGSKLKELRPLGTDVRILFVFGPDRTLVLLYAGDKEGQWNRWYRTAIAEATRRYTEYLEETNQA
jgi:hypothetical protein